MMLWCELHNTSGIKGGGITNFDPTEYEKDLAWLQTVSQVSLNNQCETELFMQLHPIDLRRPRKRSDQ